MKRVHRPPSMNMKLAFGELIVHCPCKANFSANNFCIFWWSDHAEHRLVAWVYVCGCIYNRGLDSICRWMQVCESSPSGEEAGKIVAIQIGNWYTICVFFTIQCITRNDLLFIIPVSVHLGQPWQPHWQGGSRLHKTFRQRKVIYRLSGCAQQQDEQTVPMDDCPSQEGIAYLSVISVGGLFVILIDKEKH